MPNILIFGAPGSGKGTQSRLLIDKYNLCHISTGELLRKHINAHTRLGELADSYCSRGQLIPDDLMVDILCETLDSGYGADCNGLILDGFPRNLQQAEALKKIFDDRGLKLDAVIGLEVPEELLFDRLIERGRREGRSDDNPETISKRIDVYHKVTYPLRDYYINDGTYIGIPAGGEIPEIFDTIVNALEGK